MRTRAPLQLWRSRAGRSTGEEAPGVHNGRRGNANTIRRLASTNTHWMLRLEHRRNRRKARRGLDDVLPRWQRPWQGKPGEALIPPSVCLCKRANHA
jgi:hypothetical protein